MRISITLEDIETAPICPIAARLRRQLSVPFIVGTDSLTLFPSKEIGAVKVGWPEGVREWILRSDESLPIGPISFNMMI